MDDGHHQVGVLLAGDLCSREAGRELLDRIVVSKEGQYLAFYPWLYLGSRPTGQNRSATRAA